MGRITNIWGSVGPGQSHGRRPVVEIWGNYDKFVFKTAYFKADGFIF